VLAGAWASASLILLANPAMAANTPQVGPAPAWVHAAPAVAAEKDDLKGLPFVILSHDIQLSFDADGWTEYHEVMAKVQTPQGLQALSAIPYAWSPWSDTLTFHRAVISRGGQTIDILPKDGAFTVLRRETNLNQAMLTGVLTALIQPDGLQVGDLIDIAVSVRHAHPLLKGASAAVVANWDAGPVGQMRLEAHWPSSLPVRWRETAGLPALRRTQTGGATSVELTLDDVRPPVLPAHAPARFQHGRQIEFTTLADWKQVAQIMEPLYAKAAELAPQSEVAAQAKLIAQSSTDPKQRAAAALRLVQGQVRYLAHVEDAGGFTPQSADETWRLRSGDCKAKTVLLIALLRELGVPAEPVLVSTAAGDGLDRYLPSPQLFNHVLVRVRLGGRDYWLDGTREGDGDLDGILTPAFGWVLPLDTPDGHLIRLEPSPANQPQMIQVIRYDASGGVTKPEPTQLETTFRGDAAVALHARLSAIPPERMDAALKAYWAGVHTAFTPAHVASSWDPAMGELKFTADGTSKLDWSGSGLELQHVALGGAPDIKRDPAASDPDAPYLVGFPLYAEADESVVLPPGDTVPANSIKAADVDTTIAGIAYRRKATVDGKVFRVVASMRALRPEISAVEARASVDPLTKLGNESVYVADESSTQTAKKSAAGGAPSKTVDGHLDRANALLDGGQYREALAEFDAAISLDPNSQRAWTGRALAHASLADSDAIADMDKAAGLGAPAISGVRVRGLLASSKGDLQDARAAFRYAIILEPDDDFSLRQLVNLDLRSSDLDAARQDLDRLLKSHPDAAPRAHLWRASIEAASHNKDTAEKELAQAPSTTAEDRFARAAVYFQLGDDDQARQEVDESIRLKPTAPAFLLRAGVETRAGGFASAAANNDIDGVLKLAPADENAEAWKLGAALSRYDFADALQWSNRILSDHPHHSGSSLVTRAEIEGKLSQSSQMEADFAKARAMTGNGAPSASLLCTTEAEARWHPDLALQDCEKALAAAPKATGVRLSRLVLLHRLGRMAESEAALADLAAATHDAVALNEICYTVAADDMSLDRALALCDASLKLRPNEAATLDSRAFVLLRLGRNAEALTAYDAALAANPKEYHSLYGRGLVESRLGRSADGARDIAAATAIGPRVAEEFAQMGVRLEQETGARTASTASASRPEAPGPKGKD
jgi:tetratricopeptide (TPR) repeat protein